MRSPHYFIAKPVGGKRYRNTKSVGGVELIVSTSEEDHKFSNREAEVVELPLGYEGPIKIGDILLVHHNVFKFYNDMKGRRQSGKSFFKENIFFLDPDQFFAYKKNGEWHGYDRYCFIKPIPAKESYIYKAIINEPLMGTIAILNDGLKSQGLKEGDVVCYKPSQEYEFRVDDEILWRMYDHSITLQL